MAAKRVASQARVVWQVVMPIVIGVAVRVAWDLFSGMSQAGPAQA